MNFYCNINAQSQNSYLVVFKIRMFHSCVYFNKTSKYGYLNANYWLELMFRFWCWLIYYFRELLGIMVRFVCRSLQLLRSCGVSKARTVKDLRCTPWITNKYGEILHGLHQVCSYYSSNNTEMGLTPCECNGWCTRTRLHVGNCLMSNNN